MIAMQYDQTTTFAAKLQTMLQAPGMAEPLKASIDALGEPDRRRAREALSTLLRFDGKLAAGSAYVLMGAAQGLLVKGRHVGTSGENSCTLYTLC